MHWLKRDTHPAMKVSFAYSPSVNFAMQQNHAPVVREVTIYNDTDQPVHDVNVRISFSPSFASPFTAHFDSVAPDCEESIFPVPVTFSVEFLSSLTERIEGTISLTVSSGEDEVLFSEEYPISVLSFNEWCGSGVFPEMLAAFSMPNNPEIAPLVKRASEILQQWIGDGILDEYQRRDPDRVKKQMAALFAAISERRISYCSLPASFEFEGQKIRLSDEILGGKLGCCLDMSMLYCSCLEAMGLHPVVVLLAGHAVAGAWLIGDSFADPVNDDPSLLTKRMAEGINEILLVESTFMCESMNVTFDDACLSAADRLTSGDDFLLFVDIFRARMAQIRPLPQRIPSESGWTLIEDKVTERIFSSPKELSATDIILDESTKVGKKTIWERKLLDLSLRNNLLNTRITRDTIPIISVDIDELEDALAQKADFQVCAKPLDWEGGEVDLGIYRALNPTDPVYELVKKELSMGRIRTYLDEDSVRRALTNLYRSSRTSLEENGANTLYLALGLLRWFETPSSTRPRYAPIILVPVEIVRRSAALGYIIRSRDEETMLNITLMELLRQAFDIHVGGLDPLPVDDHGVDVRLILNTIRRKIMDRPGWDVVDEAILGNFSFNKFIMWNDIHSNTSLLEGSKIVTSLMRGIIDEEVNVEIEDAEDIDSRFAPGDIELPISADSSQLEAISAAMSGKSFILHGPPGTGKSQTITNIIANALYRGKRVLFVAEKMAALEVVQNRLESIGLGPFCLELHSNKSKKSAVLEQLRRTTEVAKKGSSAEYAAEAKRIHEVRQEMNSYLQSLHRPYGAGLSLYDCFARYASLPSETPFFTFSSSLMAQMTPDRVSKAEENFSSLVAACSLVGSPSMHPLRGLSFNRTVGETEECFDRLSRIGVKASRLKESSRKVRDILFGNGSLSPMRMDEYGALSSLADYILAKDEPLFGVDTLMGVPEGDLRVVDAILSHGKAKDELYRKVMNVFDENIFFLDPEQSLREWKEAEGMGFLKRYFAKRNLARRLTPYLRPGFKMKKDDVPGILQSLVSYKKESSALEDSATGPFRTFLSASDISWDALALSKEAVLEMDSLLDRIFSDPASLSEARRSLGAALSSGILDKGKRSRETLGELSSLFSEVMAAHDESLSVLGADYSPSEGDPSDWADLFGMKTGRWSGGRGDARQWAIFCTSCSVLEGDGFGDAVSKVCGGEVVPSDIMDAFRKGLYRSYAEYILGQDPSLSLFNGTMFEEKIRRFRGLCSDFENLTRQEIVSRLSSALPSLQKEASQNSEVGILQRNIRNGCRGVSLRRFFDMIPDLLPRMCPCMLMSPISVAQYIAPDSPKFDLVIFDEASQMPTCESVGAIARGKSIIVVGDPKQMPPTSFFSTNTFDEDNPDLEDLESILDDCLALSFPSKYLRWHYRSKHESLIAFSNFKYYENRLLTFPSPDDLSSKLSYQWVEGVYERGGTRQNKAEARAVVEEIRERLLDPEKSKLSIGVVTFNSNQQSLIEDMLGEMFAQNPDLEKKSLENEEYIFVKNLENVQGDERDVILFSVGYGADRSGKIALNFGPLNREGGWRRLNVAVSRARYEMKVFSTLRSEQIDLRRTRSEGVAGLKAFLEYAEKGKDALHYTSEASSVGRDGFVENVASAIREMGYQVRTNIGCSGYRVDIGVVDPDNPSEYLIGILCDGYNFTSSKSARDREIVQMGILRKLGWKVVRLWSMDWWNSSESVLRMIEEKIRMARDGNFPEEEAFTSVFRPVGSGDSPSGEDGDSASSASAPEDGPSDEGSPIKVIPYEGYELPPKPISAEELTDGTFAPLIRAYVQRIIEREAPIKQDLLCRKILRSCGIARMGVRVSAYMYDLLQKMGLHQTKEKDSVTYWTKEQSPDGYPFVRSSSERDVLDVPIQEARNAAVLVIEEQGALPMESLLSEMSKLFGYSRVGANVHAVMEDGVYLAIRKGLLEQSGGRVKKAKGNDSKSL